MIAPIEDPSTNAVAALRGQDGTTQNGSGPAALSASPAGCSDARPVEGSSVGEIKLVLKSCKPYFRQLTLMLPASGKVLDVMLDVRNRYTVLAFEEFSLCCLHANQNFIGIGSTIFKLSDDEVRQVRAAFPMLNVREP